MLLLIDVASFFYFLTFRSNDVIQLSIWEITKSLKRSYWLIFGMTGSLWSMIYVIVVFVTDYLTEKWDMSEQDAGLTLIHYGLPV